VRRLIIDLGSAAGLSRAGATAWARQLIWGEIAGREGLAAAPPALEALARREFEPKAEPWIEVERPGVVVLRAGKTLPALVLARAAELAEQKTRETGVSAIRIRGLAEGFDPLPVLADLASGPCQPTLHMPGLGVVAALPTLTDEPLLIHSAEESGPGLALAEGEALLVTLATTIGTSPEEVGGLVAARRSSARSILPDDLGERRLRAETEGLPLPSASLAALAEVARRLGLAVSSPA
jgi:hypothetical protein